MTADDPDWKRRAACREVNQHVFFVDKGQSVFPAKGFCRTCPVRSFCLNFAMRAEGGIEYNRHGIYGGLTPRERTALHNSGWRPGQPTPAVPDGLEACPQCGKRFQVLKTHITLKHKHKVVAA